MQVFTEMQQGLATSVRGIEIVERKGLGHPDTICDMLSERLSVALSSYYLNEFGLILHHNVDKALLAAGQSEPRFGAGRIVEPMRIFLSGRATMDVQGKLVPVRELAEECAHAWFRENMHTMDTEKGVQLHCLVRPGSSDLVDLFVRQRDAGLFLANDTSIGVGYAPLTELEKIVLAVERRLNAPDFKVEDPASGEDIKVMGVRETSRIALTISCAFIGRYLHDIAAYRDAKERLRAAALQTAMQMTAKDVMVQVNAADNQATGSVFLTVSGTSAEAGDDGQTGRGNRPNGLITPCRPMTLEAMAGKNPVTHVGKLYSAAASRIAHAIVAEVPGINEAECYLVSQIGAPIDRPHLTHLRVRSEEIALGRETEHRIDAVVAREVAAIPQLWKSFLTQSIPVAG